ncbi:hypothetical protein GCM10010329_39340 [Streptomyces spiroverticillatus]|uniref:DUF2029 domain-containing protein n=1 Tax=Streptomyces finlayi TaxID=67296 RepID=A0A918WZJ5_9ACTN|nr:hypothetical protein GCM10010329_39340 [Streptomyces spiroverticillatus]GHC98406.1 hypothetical protein GCM10010334_40900 [Streptomyces finlayi]
MHGPRSAPMHGPRSVETMGWLACSVFAALLASLTDLVPHRVWGVSAATGYGAAALLSCRSKTPWNQRSSLVAAAGAVLVPLAMLVVSGARQLEVHVVEQSGLLLLTSGSPYVSAPSELWEYNPYLPGMALFGLPKAVLGGGILSDAGIWFGIVFLGSMFLAVRTAAKTTTRRNGPGEPRATPCTPLLLLAAAPVVALPLAVGGVDLPVIGLMCLALALAGRGGSGVAVGLALGAAAALKWTAWPLLPVGLVLLLGAAGRRSAARAALVALAVCALALLPVVLANPSAFAEHVLLFPLGEGGTGSPATSPLPGHLLTTYVPGGFALALGALVLAAAGVALSLVVRPPRSTAAASNRLALGLALAMCLLPATRFGYLAYPLVLVCWHRLTSAAGRPTGTGAVTTTGFTSSRPASTSYASVPSVPPTVIRVGAVACSACSLVVMRPSTPVRPGPPGRPLRGYARRWRRPPGRLRCTGCGGKRPVGFTRRR